MAKFYLIACLVPLLLYAAEPSAFEKQSGATKDDIKNIQRHIANLQAKVDSIQQTQEGVSSLYESQSNKLQKQIIENAEQGKRIEEIQTQLDTLNNLKKQVDSNTQAIKNIKTQLQEINKSITTLNQSILAELNKINTPAQASQTEQKFVKDKTKQAEIFAQAKKFYEQKSYNSAKERFVWLAQINYKKAECYFYLGEIAFETKSHNDAISYYKESVMSNDKATYMPTLLLHTAQSFNAIKDTKNYNKFLDSLITNYPTSKEAQSAKKLKNQK